VNSPGGKAVQNVIDQNSNTKYLDFNAFDGIGFQVDLLSVAYTAIAMEIVTANDAPERDPANYEIFGSNDRTNFTSIAREAFQVFLHVSLSEYSHLQIQIHILIID